MACFLFILLQFDSPLAEFMQNEVNDRYEWHRLLFSLQWSHGQTITIKLVQLYTLLRPTFEDGNACICYIQDVRVRVCMCG